MKNIRRIVLILTVIVYGGGHCYSFETSTHSELSKHSVINSTLDNFLKTQLSFTRGIDEPLTGETDAGTTTKTVEQWVQEGSVREDDDFRFLNHFHNPLRGWTQAGLGLTGGKSSILWAQDPEQGYEWKDARDSYFDGLTATTKAEREDKLAKTFRALGQLIHFVQDASVPAHARDDPHPPWNKDALERFTDTSQDRLPVTTLDSLVGTPIPFSPSILECTPNSAAPVRIACITDTTDSEQTQATPSAGTNQGMAEYTNANFLSTDTIFKDFTFPRLESVDLMKPLILNNRRYYTKVADGETGFFLAAEGTFTDRLLLLSWFDKGFILDPLVSLDYAAKLFPRAVGYSAGLIDYFFRGFIGSTDSDAFRNQPPFPANNPPTTIAMMVTNDEAGSGIMVAVLTFVGTFGAPTTEIFPEIIVSEPTAVALTGSLQEVTFSFNALPFPSDVLVSSFYDATLVYSGPLGDEDEAVIGSRACPGFSFNHGIDFFGNETVWATSNCES